MNPERQVSRGDGGAKRGHIWCRRLQISWLRVTTCAVPAMAFALAVTPSFAQSSAKHDAQEKHLRLSATVTERNEPLGIPPGNAGVQTQTTPQQPQASTALDGAQAQAQPGVQLLQPPGGSQGTAPVTITLQDALERARKYDAQFQGVLYDAKSAKEDRVQARNAILPTISYTSQALLAEGNGGRTKIGRFVTQDGVHVYRSWGELKEDLSPANYLLATYDHGRAAEAVAQAKAEIARRGLTVTVTNLYYGLIVAQRKYATAQAASDAAKHFYQITEDAERVGQVAHSDVIQAEVQYSQQQQAFDDAHLAMNNARLDLGVLIGPQLNINFTAVDDLDSPVALPPFSETERMAEHENPDLAVAMQTLRQAKADLLAAKSAFLPDFYTDSVYGIEANYYALHSVNVQDVGAGVLPNLGYFITVGVNVPVWDWGTLRSKLHQAEYKRDQARIQLSQAQRQLVSNLYSSYNEALTAQDAVSKTRHTAELATESLRLINLRYQAGETAALDVVSAENTLTQTRNAYADAELRYRVAIATLQTVTGSF
ncbi:MAG: TolC family protein [Candidatus Acidiferrales bacterium]